MHALETFLSALIVMVFAVAFQRVEHFFEVSTELKKIFAFIGTVMAITDAMIIVGICTRLVIITIRDIVPRDDPPQ